MTGALGETFWFILVVWILMLAFNFRYKETVLGAVTGLTGLFFGITLMDSVNWLSYIIMVFNVYILFVALIKEEKKR